MAQIRVCPPELTTDLISPPLSPTSGFDFNLITPQVLSGLEYVSKKLQSKLLHLTLIASRPKPLPIGQGSSIHVLPVGFLPENTCLVFKKYIKRAAKKYHLRSKWMVLSLDTDSVTSPDEDYITCRSLKQNDILYDFEGLTILHIDRIYTLKQYLNTLSTSKPGDTIDHIPRHVYMDVCTSLLHNLMRGTGGRPFAKSFFNNAYDHLDVKPDVLQALAKAYLDKYKQTAIVFPKPKLQIPVSKSPQKPVVKHRRRDGSTTPSPGGGRKSLISLHSAQRRARTPHSASDVTPITRNEWNLLIPEPSSITRQQPVQITI
ncbi:hypothetical protein FQN57_000174 [Myotisia sp. PD_48]|nr:hypothetical protein FQN57_000174 [Myotisia sp. PD_48]